MAKRDNIGSSANLPSSPACGQWETLLVDALDGLLRPEDEAEVEKMFQSHPKLMKTLLPRARAMCKVNSLQSLCLKNGR